MAVPLQGNVSHDEIVRDGTHGTATCVPQRKWYFSREEIKHQTPSRANGIDYKRETHLQKLYCSFLQELGIELKVPQVTIATAMMLCHRFYMRQSHAKNNWQTISTACMFLACKAEETPRWLGELVVVAYKLIYKSDPSAPRRIREIYDKQKELIVVAERLILATVGFDLNIEHPYKPLVAALKKFDITHKELVKVAWNFVNDCLRTSLCLQHKPHYIAAGSIFLAAKFQKVKLPSEKGKVWWMEFDVSPKQLEEVIQQMMDLWQQNRKLVVPPKDQCLTEPKHTISKALSSSPQSCILSGSTTAHDSKTAASPDSGRPAKSTSSTCTHTQSSGKVDECLQDSKSVPSADADRLATTTCTCIQTQAYHNVHEPLKDIKTVASPHADKSENFIASTFIQMQTYCNVHESSKDSKTVGSPATCRLAKSTTSTCTQTQAFGKVNESSQEAVNCQISDCGSANSIVDDGDGGEPVTGKSGPISSYKIGSLEVGHSQFDVNWIREKLKKRKFNRISNKKSAETMDEEIDGEAWIERELENGIELESSFPEKRKRI